MKNTGSIIALAVILIVLVLLFNNRIFLRADDNEKEIPVVSAGFENKVNEPEVIPITSHMKDTSESLSYIKLHYDALLADTHNDFIWKVFDKGASFGTRNSFTQSDLPRLLQGGVDIQVFAIWIPMNQVKRSMKFVTGQIDRISRFEEDYPDQFGIADSYEDIIRITGEKKLCGLIGIEGGTVIGDDLDNINLLAGMRVKYIGLTWNNSNLIATSAKDESERGKQSGLTEYGKQVVQRMNETGIMVDVSHLSEAAFWAVIETTTMPIIASHSNCYAINPHYRNLTDEQIKAIAKNGGYIGINFYDKFIDKDADRNRTLNAYEQYSAELNELNEKYGDDLIRYNEERNKFLSEKNLTAGTNIDKVIEHIDHIKNLVGVDVIGIGSDFDGGISPVNELYDATTYPILTQKLMERGYTGEEIRKILGGNFLRVFKKVCG